MSAKRANYLPTYPKRLYTYFLTYSENGAPSFSKFARAEGILLEDIERFRAHKEFDRAYRECNEIRRDYLIDQALCRRHDPSFVKYLLSIEYGEEKNEEEDNALALTLSVIP